MNKFQFQGRTYFFSLILLLSVITFTVTGCRLLKRDQQTIAEKKKEEADKKANAEYEKARKKHYKQQNKETKKMMKRTKKQAAEFNKPMKRKSIFKPKCD